jgi:hypothetical protein
MGRARIFLAGKLIGVAEGAVTGGQILGSNAAHGIPRLGTVTIDARLLKDLEAALEQFRTGTRFTQLLFYRDVPI